MYTLLLCICSNKIAIFAKEKISKYYDEVTEIEYFTELPRSTKTKNVHCYRDCNFIIFLQPMH